MKAKYQKAFDALKTLGVPVYEHADDNGNFSIDAEDPKADDFVGYYATQPDWIFGVHPAVNTTLRNFGLFAEWVNPGRLSVYEG